MHLKLSSGKWRPFCLSLNVFTLDHHLFRKWQAIILISDDPVLWHICIGRLFFPVHFGSSFDSASKETALPYKRPKNLGSHLVSGSVQETADHWKRNSMTDQIYKNVSCMVLLSSDSFIHFNHSHWHQSNLTVASLKKSWYLHKFLFNMHHPLFFFLNNWIFYFPRIEYYLKHSHDLCHILTNFECSSYVFESCPNLVICCELVIF